MSNIGELFMLGFRGPTVPAWMKDFAREFGLGGVLLFDYDVLDKKYERNVFSVAQVKELCAEIHALPSRPRVYVDQEGGKVRRLKEKYGFAPLASAKNFPKLGLSERKAQLAESFRQMRDTGIDCDLAPVVDLDINPANPDLGAVERCYSADKATVLENARLLAEAGREFGVDLCLKHFPGCGAATVNSHLDLMDLTDVVTEEQISLFRDLTPEIPNILFSHGMVRNWDAQLPCSLSPAAVTLARPWSPNGIFITDDLQMEGMQKRMTTAQACVLAVRAGLDMLCIGHNLRDEQQDSAKFARAVSEECDKNGKSAAHVESSLRRLKLRKGK